MRRTLVLVAVASLVSIGVFKIVVLPGTTIADTAKSGGVGQAAMSVYDMDVRYPSIKALPVEEAPLP